MAHASRTNRPRVLVVDGDPSYALGGSLYRGLVERGWDAHYFDESVWLRTSALSQPTVARRLARRAVRLVSQPVAGLALATRAAALQPDVTIVCKGYYYDPVIVRALARMSGTAAVYFTDDVKNPLNTHPRMLQALPEWDVAFTPRSFALEELKRDGAKRVEYLPFGYDPKLFHPTPASALAEDVTDKVVFVGAWAPDRPAPLAAVAREFPVVVYGSQWNRTDLPPELLGKVRPPIYGEQVRAVMSNAAINIGLLRRDNRDLHVMRTFEIPACAGFLLAERTSEHAAFFAEDREAVFFEDNEDLVAKVRRYLPDAALRRKIAQAGHAHIVDGHNTYADRAEQMVERCLQLRARRVVA